MPLSSVQLTAELAMVVDPNFASAIVDSYVEMQQRFFAGDWKPAELDGGRLCEAISRALYQLDSGVTTHSELPGKLCDWLEDYNNKRSHNLADGDRRHFCKAIRLVYKLRSDRGPVHISPDYTANEMDSVLMLHAGKWMFAEFLRLAWNKDRKLIAETIADVIQLEHSLVHEIDGTPLILDHTVSAPEEILLLINHAIGHKLQREELTRQAKNNSSSSLGVAISRLTKSNELRTTGVVGELAITPKGQKRVIEKIIPKLKANRLL
ncbi:hypothetical protein [Bryobacter aggregatus]|uniref:hypothetical protein n=1 Tax=Bryobacter aggregatus TaxID=360054 RepID=UPI0004E159FA|nr:hypothetical protein [Bryobacter aggregatus]